VGGTGGDAAGKSASTAAGLGTKGMEVLGPTLRLFIFIFAGFEVPVPAAIGGLWAADGDDCERLVMIEVPGPAAVGCLGGAGGIGSEREVAGQAVVESNAAAGWMGIRAGIEVICSMDACGSEAGGNDAIISRITTVTMLAMVA
jgi:hypothetical protein